MQRCFCSAHKKSHYHIRDSRLIAVHHSISDTVTKVADALRSPGSFMFPPCHCCFVISHAIVPSDVAEVAATNIGDSKVRCPHCGMALMPVSMERHLTTCRQKRQADIQTQTASVLTSDLLSVNAHELRLSDMEDVMLGPIECYIIPHLTSCHACVLVFAGGKGKSYTHLDHVYVVSADSCPCVACFCSRSQCYLHRNVALVA